MSNAPVSLFARVRSPHDDQFLFFNPGSNRDSDGTPSGGGSDKPTSAHGAPLGSDGFGGLAAMRASGRLTPEERLALREAQQAERQAEKEAMRAERQAEKEALKAERQAEKEAFKAQRQAEKEAQKAERKAEKEAQKAERQAEKEAQRQERDKAKKEKNKPGEDDDNGKPVVTPDEPTGDDNASGGNTDGDSTGGEGTSGGSTGGSTGGDSDTDTASATGIYDGELDVTGGTVGSDGLLTRYVSGGDASTSFNIDLNFAGDGWTAELQADMVAAADYLSRFLIGDLPDSTMFNGTVVDDIRIDATLAEIDGRGKILGRAGPREYRDDLTPKQGIMEFDSADAERFDDLGRWDDIVLHEMMHVLGFGTVWSAKGLTSSESDTLRFTGEKATAVYLSEFGSDPNWGDDNMAAGVPIETDFGAGTAGAHWDEALFDNELMTGIIDKNNYMSLTTLAALDDLGYETVIDNLFNFDDQVLLV